MIFDSNLFLILILLIPFVVASFLWLRSTQQVSDIEVEGSFFDSHLGPIYYRKFGKKGDWVVMVHGIGSSTYCWRHIVPELEKTYQILTIDLWGFGQSSKDLTTPMSLDGQVELIQKLLKHLKIKKYFFVGHSLGGEIGLWLSTIDKHMKKCIAITPSAHPRLVSRLVNKFTWAAKWSPLWLNKKLIGRILFNLIRNRSLINDEMIESYYRPYADAKAHLSFVAALNIIQDPRVFDNLHKIPKGTVMLWGGTDQVVPKRISRLIQEKTPQVTHFTHPTAGHLPTEDDYTWVISHLKDQLK